MYIYISKHFLKFIFCFKGTTCLLKKMWRGKLKKIIIHNFNTQREPLLTFECICLCFSFSVFKNSCEICNMPCF